MNRQHPHAPRSPNSKFLPSHPLVWISEKDEKTEGLGVIKREDKPAQELPVLTCAFSNRGRHSKSLPFTEDD